MDIVTLDFETYYSREYGLGKMTTEEYVRDPRFEVIGVSVKVNDNPTDWYTGDDPGTFLNSLDYSNKAILCHNTAFDGAILSWHYNIKPKLWLDTLSMARPLHQATVGGSLRKLVLFYHLGKKGTEVVDAFGKRRADFTQTEIDAYGGYCINDTELTYQLFQKLKVEFPISELMVIDQTIRMYTEPVLELDRPALEQHLVAEKTRKLDLLTKLGNGDPENARGILMSNKKFAALLAALGADIPMKTSSTTGKETYAFAKTDQGMLALKDHSDPAIAAVVEARLGVKSTLEETRTQRLIDVSKRGPLPIMLNYYGAHTGRFSGGDKMNLQNLPSRTNKTIRKTICAPAGCKLIACDSSQIEARVVAQLAGQHDLIEAFRQGRDVYSEFASRVFGRTITKANGTERFVGKTCILGLGYGMGHVKFRDTLALAGISIDETEAKRIVYLYRDTYQKIKDLWTHCDGVLSQMTSGQSGLLGDLLAFNPYGIKLPNGLTLKYNALRSTADGFSYISDARSFTKFTAHVVSGADPEDIPWTNIYGGKVVENVVQALARIIIADQMVAIGQYYHVVFQVHDENIICVPDEEVAVAKQVMEREMSVPPAWALTLPIACESGIGDNFGECK